MKNLLFVFVVLVALMVPLALAADAEAPSNLSTKAELVYMWVNEEGTLTVLAKTGGIGYMIDFGALTATPIGDSNCKAFLDDAGVPTIEMEVPAGQTEVFSEGVTAYLAGPNGWPASATSDVSKMASAVVTNQRVIFKVPNFTKKIKIATFGIIG